MKKLFTFFFAFVMLFAFTINAQNSGISKTGIANKIDNKGKIAKLNNHRNTKAIIFSEDFAGGALPTGWQNIDNISSGFSWYFNNPGARTLNSTTSVNGFASADSDFDGTGSLEDCDLITPAIDCSALTVVKLSFEHYFNSIGNDQGQLSVSGDNGATWTIVQTWLADNTNATADVFDISTVAAGQTQVLIKWNYQGAYSWYWLLDDISVFEPSANDLGVSAITPSFVMSGNSAIPQVTIDNLGSVDQATWSVTLTDGIYTSTMANLSNIVVGTSLVVNMDPWTPAAGTHTLTATVTLAGDANAANDVLTQNVTVLLTSYTTGTLYGYDAYSTGATNLHTVTVNKTTAAIGDLALSTTGDFLSCGDYINGNVYGVEYGSNDLYLVNGDGATYKIGTITGVSSITGIAYDATNDIVYLADYGSTSTLFTLNMVTLAATSVGVITSNLIIGIAAGNNGEVWGIDITTDHFWSINTATGAGTDVGPLGPAISYAQDIGFDRAAGILYGTLYTTTGELYTINTTTGVTTLVGTLTSEITMCAIASDACVPTTITIVDVAGTLTSDAATGNQWYDGSGLIAGEINQTYTPTLSGNYYVIVTDVNGCTSMSNVLSFLISVNLNASNSSIIVYPNPANDKVCIEVSNKNASQTKIEIRTIDGRLVFEKESNNTGNARVYVDLKEFATGIYIVKAISNENTSIQKLIVK